MSNRYNNPFAGTDLLAPIDQRDDYDHYAERTTSRVIDQSPFPRKVDLWFLGICVAAQDGLEPVDLTSRQTTKFMDGQVLSSDPWRINALMLLALARHEDLEILTKPRQIIAMANGLAAAGVPKVLEMLKEDRHQEPIWNLSEALEQKIKEAAQAS